MNLARVLRILVVCEIVVAVAWIVLRETAPGLLPAELQSFVAEQESREWSGAEWVLGGLDIVVFGICVWSWIALIRLSPRGRALYTAAWALSLALTPFREPHADSGPGQALNQLSVLLSGMTFGLLYFSELRHRFGWSVRPGEVEKPSSAADSRPTLTAAAPPALLTSTTETADRHVGARSHLKAGCFAVTGVAILSVGYLFPTILRGSGKSSQDGVISIAIVLAVSLVVAVAVWLVVYLPLSSLAEKMGTTTAARMKWSAVLCTVTLLVVTMGVLGRIGIPLWFALAASVVLGCGGAVYSFFRGRIAHELSLTP